MKIDLTCAEETELLGHQLWQILPFKSLVFLNGELGAGKTTLVRGMLRSAGYSGNVKSPTFTIVEEYSVAERKIFHFDLYRLSDPEELEWIGIQDYLAQNSLCLIEWPSLGQGYLPEPDLVINLAITGNSRHAELLFNSKNKQKNTSLHWKNKDLLL